MGRYLWRHGEPRLQAGERVHVHDEQLDGHIGDERVQRLVVLVLPGGLRHAADRHPRLKQIPLLGTHRSKGPTVNCATMSTDITGTGAVAFSSLELKCIKGRWVRGPPSLSPSTPNPALKWRVPRGGRTAGGSEGSALINAKSGAPAGRG